jgi:hypothetical protein
MSAKLGSNPWGQILAVALGITLMLSGGIDVWRVIRLASPQRIISINDMELGQQLSQIVPSNQPIMTAPTCFTGAILSGRQLVEGYQGHLWSQGYNYEKRYDNIRAVYAGDPTSSEILKQYGVRYVEIGSLERASLPAWETQTFSNGKWINVENPGINQSYFSQFRVAIQVGDTQIYDMQSKVSK